MLLGHLLPQKGNCEITFNYFLFMLYCASHIHFEIWECKTGGKGILEVVAIN